MRNLKILFSTPLFILLFASCQKDALDEYISDSVPKTRAIPTLSFDWENADWMPTPPGQSRIPSPWMGAGSILPEYGADITNDRYKTDGWELLYNTFDPNAPGELINPYFVLYNKYRGLIRIYLYLTTEFVAPSSYLLETISIDTNNPTSMLRFLGKDIIDATESPTSYTQVEGRLDNGSSPLASRKWYMMQYELAYDPNISSYNPNYMYLSWNINYCNIAGINLGGEQVGTIAGTIGVADASTTLQTVKSETTNITSTVGSGVLSGIGVNFLDKNAIGENGDNKLGLPKTVFKEIFSGIKSALSGSVQDLPKALAKGILNIIFGSTTTQPIPVNLQFKTQITMEGTLAEQGAFPSAPFTFWIPGINVSSSMPGYIPLYNKSLGVLNITQEPYLSPSFTRLLVDEINQIYDVYAIYRIPDFSQLLIINPEVKEIADISISQEILACQGWDQYESFVPYVHVGKVQKGVMIDHPSFYSPLFVRFIIKVTPKNGDASSIIVKTVKINHEHKREMC